MLAVLAAWGVGCANPSATDAEGRVLEVHHRLFSRAPISTSGTARVPLPALDAVGDCAVGDEIRPAFGCPTFVREWRWRDRNSPRGIVEHRLRIDPPIATRPLIVERAFRRRDVDPWMPLPPLRLARAGHEPVVSFEVPSKNQTRAIVHVSMPTVVVRRSEAIVIPRDAVLHGGVGFHALGVQRDVRFRIVAAVDGRQRTLLDERVAHGETRWKDYRLDLSEIEGRTVVFTFATSGVGAGARGAPLPLWSRPVIVAPAPTRTMPNVIIVSLDTLRGDYVGASGRGRVDTPALDGLAGAGAYFSDAMAPYPSTTASHMSLFTALYPSAHEVRVPSKVLPLEIRTLAETLSHAGYATAAVTEDGMLLARSGFQRGFDSYREFKEALPTMTSGHAEQVTAAGLAWIDAHRGERFFLFLHTYQVHAPYAPQVGFDRHRTPDGQNVAQVERDRRAYADEVEYTDHVVGAFFQALDDRGLSEQMILVVVADHGEAFGEHGLVLHGSSVHDPQVRVPLILRAPGRIPAGVRIDVPVSLVDVAPTILDLLGIPMPTPVQGRTLVPLLDGGDDAGLPGRPVFAEVGSGRTHAIAVRVGGTKWIVDSKGARVFDLRTDPDESAERTMSADVAPGAQMVMTFKAESERLKELAGGAPAPTASPIDPDAEGRLRALGYLE